jgi:hypothetical protein
LGRGEDLIVIVNPSHTPGVVLTNDQGTAVAISFTAVAIVGGVSVADAQQMVVNYFDSDPFAGLYPDSDPFGGMFG